MRSTNGYTSKQMGSAVGATRGPGPPMLSGPLLDTTARALNSVTISLKKSPVGPDESGNAPPVMLTEMLKSVWSSAIALGSIQIAAACWRREGGGVT